MSVPKLSLDLRKVSPDQSRVLGNARKTTPIISIIGTSNTGKTTLFERVIKELKSRGFRVAAIKHAHHGFDIDRPGKDSWRLTQAGSDVVALSSPDKMAFIERLDTELTPDQISTLFENKVDIVLTEGYKNGTAPKILVVTSEQDNEHLRLEEKPFATVSACLSPLGIPQFGNDDVIRIVDLLVAQIGKNSLRNLADNKDTAVDLLPRHDSYQASEFEELLAESASVHGHICPGQVLGVRMALLGCRELGIEDPRKEPKRLIVYVEIDRCATDAIQVVTGCKLGKRTMKYVDYGKLAATFVDTVTGDAVRIVAREDAREKAALGQSQGWTRHEAEVAAYRIMPDEELFCVEKVLVKIPVEDMPGPPRRRVICEQCDEGINDGRDVMIGGKILCRSCAYGGYYQRYEVLQRNTPVRRYPSQIPKP